VCPFCGTQMMVGSQCFCPACGVVRYQLETRNGRV
jgi:hypothetical protein